MPGLIVAPLVLAAVFGLSAVTKILDKTNSTLSVMQLLRLPKAIAQPWAAKALPWGELVLAAALLLSPAGPMMTVAALAALVLTLVYWVIVARAMTFRPRPSCGCFGRIGDQRINAKTVARNTLLVGFAISAVVFAFRHRSVIGAVGGMSKGHWSWLVALVATAVLAVLISSGSNSSAPPIPPTAPGGPGVSHATGGIQAVDALHGSVMQGEVMHSDVLRGDVLHGDVPHGDVIGDDLLDYERAPIPHTLLTDPDGKQHTLAELARERAQLLVFVNCTCGSTHLTADLVPQWSERLPALDVRFVLAGLGHVEISQLGGQTSETFWHDHAAVASHALGATTGASPAAVLLGADGLLAGGPVFGVEAATEFVDQIEEQLSAAAPVDIDVTLSQ